MFSISSARRDSERSPAHALSLRSLRLGTALLTVSLTLSGMAVAQDADEEADREDSVAMMSTVTVTTQKKSVAEDIQSVPIAVTALTSAQLDALNFRSLEDVGIISPNATLDRNGNSKSLANFTIRGVGSNSSIVSIEPAVAVFMNGVYLGIPAGNVVDTYDLANVQILRGPQGTLFGRNVTGGAVLMETRRPSGETGGEVYVSYETGPEYSVAGAYETSLAPGVADLRVAGLYRKDEGWFTNEFDGEPFGEQETWFLRPTLSLSLGESVEQTFILDVGEEEGDGAAEQGFNLIGEGDGFMLNLNRVDPVKLEWTSLTSDTSINVGFGNGVITNIFGYRAYESSGATDIDASPALLFHSNSYIDQEQFSNELRYAGTFGDLDLTTGVFYFTQDVFLAEDRDPFIAGPQGGGGTQDHSSYGVFAQGTYALSDQLNLVAGLRYSYEEKSARIVRRQPGGCDASEEFCDFSLITVDDSDSWNSLSPKLGLEYTPNEDVLLYATVSQATRSGGFNLRLASPIDPGKFDQETVTTYEIGSKGDYFDNRLRANLAIFHNEFDGLQRTVNQTITTDIIQTLTNAADAKSTGFDAEFIFVPVEGIELLANAGYVDMEYTEVFYDLSGDGVVDETDLALKTPRVSPWSYSFGILGYHELESGAQLRGQLIFSYRDPQAAQDRNDTYFDARNDLKANITYVFPSEQFEVSVYGRNLLNEPGNSGARGPLGGAFPSGGFSSLGEGTSVGVSLRARF